MVISMALLGEPELLIADEPVSALDVAIQESIMALLKKISTERGMAILFISHDLRTVYFMCHNVIVLKYLAQLQLKLQVKLVYYPLLQR